MNNNSNNQDLQNLKDDIQSLKERLNSIEYILKLLEQNSRHLLSIRSKLEDIQKYAPNRSHGFIYNLFSIIFSWKNICLSLFISNIFTFANSDFIFAYKFTKTGIYISEKLHVWQGYFNKKVDSAKEWIKKISETSDDK